MDIHINPGTYFEERNRLIASTDGIVQKLTVNALRNERPSLGSSLLEDIEYYVKTGVYAEQLKSEFKFVKTEVDASVLSESIKFDVVDAEDGTAKITWVYTESEKNPDGSEKVHVAYWLILESDEGNTKTTLYTYSKEEGKYFVQSNCRLMAGLKTMLAVYIDRPELKTSMINIPTFLQDHGYEVTGDDIEDSKMINKAVINSSNVSVKGLVQESKNTLYEDFQEI